MVPQIRLFTFTPRGAGTILVMGSTAGRIVYENGGSYTAAKHGTAAVAETLRLELPQIYMMALGLLLMTGVIQLIVPDGWANFHLYWASMALALMAMGAGPFSLDALPAMSEPGI